MAMKADKIAGQIGHKHSMCGHGCFCHSSSTPNCLKCDRAFANKAMREIYGKRSAK